MQNKYRYNPKTIVVCLLVLLIVLPFVSCKKQDDFLNIKSNKNDVTPTTLQDFQALLDDSQDLNSYNSILGLVGTDNIVISDANLNALPALSRNAYLWNQDIFAGGYAGDWLYSYQGIAYANVVLDGLEKLNPGSSPLSYNNIKGSALFYRAFNYYTLAQLFCKPFQGSSNTDMGLPLRLNSDVNDKPGRGTVQQTYDRIIQDLQDAVDLLPATPLYTTRPSSVAANALLAKVYLTMQKYTEAFNYADKALKNFGTLLNYNTLTIGATNPFPAFNIGNPEIIYFSMTYGLSTVWSATSVKARVAPTLYTAYDDADLRKRAFYTADGSTGSYLFKGSYSAKSYNFDGIATDELYLIRAECNARAAKISDALADLNLLLKNRYSSSAYQPISITDPTILMNRIILERRREMPYTGNMRWEDLRRFNQDPKYSITLTRNYAGATYTLLPNDNRYTLPLPDDEIQIGGLPQNPR